MNNKNIKFKIISPSSNNIDSKYEMALAKKAEKVLSSINAKYEYGELFYKKESYLSGIPELRAKELHNAIVDNTTDIIISAQGGNNSNDLLPFLDFELITKYNKPIMGFSDNTILLNVIATKSKITTYHGVDYIWSIGKYAKKYTVQNLKQFCEGIIKPMKNPEATPWSSIQYGKGKGTILGGCLSSFCLLLGTNFDPIQEINKNYILFLEDINETKSEIHSKLVQIKQHNKFKKCQGIVIGNFKNCHQKPETNNDPLEILINRIFSDINIPIAKIDELGHGVENIIIPIGKEGQLVCKDEVTIKF